MGDQIVGHDVRLQRETGGHPAVVGAFLVHDGVIAKVEAQPAIGFRHQHRLGHRRRPARPHQNLEHRIQRAAVRGAAGDDRLDILGCLAKGRRRHADLVALHPVDVALQRVDLAVVGEHPEGLGQPPLREGVGAVTLVINRKSGLEPLIHQIGVEGGDLFGQHHALVDDRPAGQGAQIHALNPGGIGGFLNPAADDVKLTLKLLLIDVLFTADKDLLNLGTRRIGLVAQNARVHGHMPPAMGPQGPPPVRPIRIAFAPALAGRHMTLTPTEIRALRAAGYTIEELELAGLSKMGERGPIDKFRNRLTWPIRDISGDVVGFGARKLASDEEDQGPKYLNTSETPIYKKSQVLYGLDMAKKEIAKKRQVVIVEGYTDVMAAHLAGITTAVATCGTAFGAEHIRIIRRLLMDDDAFRGEVIFTFDGDAAGQKAAMRAFSEDQKFVTQTFVAVEPDGLDPCDLRQHKGDLALRDLIARRVPLFEFAIRAELAHHKLDTAEGRVNALNAAAPLVAQIRDKSLRPEYTRLLAGWLGVEVEIVTRAVAQGAKAAPQQSRQQVEEVPAQPNFRPDPNEARLILEREVLKSRLQEPQLFEGELWSSIEPGAFTHPAYSAMRTAIDAHEKISPEVITDENLRALFTELTVEPIRADGKPTQLYVASIVARLREVAISRSIADLKSSLQRLNPVENEIEYNAAFAQLVALESARRSLHDLALGSL